MSTQPTPPSPPPAKPPVEELRIVSHSNLFYWWPVWVVGFLMGIISLVEGYQLAAVPAGTHKARLESSDATVRHLFLDAEGKEHQATNTSNIEKGQLLLYHPENPENRPPMPPRVGISASRGPGVIFCTVLLVVIFITNIHLRGLWSLIVIVIIVSLVIILAFAGAWDWIFEQLRFLDVRISTGGYFLVSGILLALWLVIFFLFDPQVYMVFTPGQFRVRLEIGEGEYAYDTRGMTVHKVRSDFFRHWILGLGSGDLIVKTTGAQSQEFHLHNVVFVSQKVKIIQEMVAGAGR